jgi:predicted DCC family thiol-disulfide oxidoreductase YuxK
MKGIVIIYDDRCSVCCWFIELFKKNIIRNIECFSVRSIEARTLLRQNNIQFIELNTIFVIENAIVYKKSDAFFLLIKNSKYPLRFFIIFNVLPVNTLNFFYNVFSKNRYKISKFFKLNHHEINNFIYFLIYITFF